VIEVFEAGIGALGKTFSKENILKTAETILDGVDAAYDELKGAAQAAVAIFDTDGFIHDFYHIGIDAVAEYGNDLIEMDEELVDAATKWAKTVLDCVTLSKSRGPFN